MTLALNVAAPLLADKYGKAAFDAVDPTLLIGWAEVGPGLLRALARMAARVDERPDAARRKNDGPVDPQPDLTAASIDDLVDRARREDADHRLEHQRPISAEALRKRLHIGARRSRELVAAIRRVPE